MHKSKLIDKLRDELRDFARFIESPYFNTDKRMIQLFDYLKTYYPEFESKELDRAYVAGQLFPEWKEKQYNKISYLMTDLSQLVSDFMTVRELENDRLEWQQLELKAYKRRHGDWFFNSAVKKLNKALDKGTERGIGYYFHRYRLNHEIYTHNATERVQIGIESLHNAIHNLDLFYFCSKLLYGSEVRLREAFLSEKSELVLLDEILEVVQLPVFKNEAFLRIFSLIIKLYQKDDKSIYNEIKPLIYNSLHLFNTDEKLDIISFINNYCIIKYNQASFIHQYGQYLREEIRTDIRTIALCRLEFSMGNFEKTLEHLRNMDFVDVTNSVSAKVFQLRCYYELDGYEEVFYDACNAFTQYCRRNKVIGKLTKERHLEFIKFLKKLHQAKYYRKNNKKILLHDFKKQPILFKDWLEEKIREDIRDKKL